MAACQLPRCWWAPIGLLLIRSAPAAPEPWTQDAAPTPVVAQDGEWKRRALIVGVSDYPEADGWVQLPGAVRDARRIAELLVSQFAFPEESVRLLLNEQATRTGILDTFREHLIVPADEKTIAVFFFAGHGSQMYDDGEDELDDQLDETIVPFGALVEGEIRGDIRDDELNALFGDLAEITPYVVGLFDCCHSGTVTRGGSLDVDLDVVSRRAPRYLPAGVEVKAVRDSQGRPLDLRALKSEPVILTACLDSQLALESRKQQRGLFSLALERALRGVDPNTSWGDVYRRVRADLRGMVRNQQTPVISGPDQSLVFNGSFERPTSYPTTACSREVGDDGIARWFVSVDAGYLHGFAEGSLLSLVPEESGIGASYEARVTRSQVAECTAELEVRRTPSGAPLASPPRSDLVALHEGRYGASLLEGPGRELELAVRLDPSLGDDRPALARFLADSPYFGVADADFDLQLGRGPDGFEAVDAYGNRILPHPIRMLPGHTLEERSDPDLLVDDLQAFARWDAVRGLQNFDGPLAHKVDVLAVPGWFADAKDDTTFVAAPDLWLVGPQGEPCVSMDLEQQRRQTEPDGQAALELTLVNEHDRPVYYVMFDVLPDWFVTKIDAITGSLEPGEARVLRINVTEDGHIGEGTPEMLKFFFTEQPEDFRYVNSTGIRQKQDLHDPMLSVAAQTRGGGSGGGGRLSELLGAAMSGLRGAAPAAGGPVIWTSREVQFSVIPRTR